MNIYFTDGAMDSVVVYHDDGRVESIMYPPQSDEDKKLVEDFGGEDAIHKSTAEYTLQLEREADIREYIESIDGMITDYKLVHYLLMMDFDRDDLLKQKMELFTDEDVVACKDKELLGKLRKADSLLKVVTYFGMIKLGE